MKGLSWLGLIAKYMGGLLAVSLVFLTFTTAVSGTTITLVVNSSPVHSYFGGTPNEITAQITGSFGNRPISLDLQPGVPMVSRYARTVLTTGEWPGFASGLMDTQTIHYSVTVGSETAQLSQDLEAGWISNNQAMFTLYPAMPVVLDLGSVGRLTITQNPQPIRHQGRENESGFGAIIRATFLLEASVTCNGLPATIVGTDDPELLLGTNGDDVIVGLGGGDTIRGMQGNDTICGGGGDDFLRGGSGDDVIFGEEDNDLISAGGGNDSVDGGPGDDQLHGGDGDDSLVGGPGDDEFAGAGGTNICITDAEDSSPPMDCE